MQLLKVDFLPLDLNDPDHISCMYKVRTHKEVTPFLHGAPPKTFLEHTQFLYTVKNKEFFILKVDHQLCGYCSRASQSDEIELGWAIHPDYWGQGIGKSAIKEFIAQSLIFAKPLVLTVQKNNPRAIQLYKDHCFSIIEETSTIYKMRYDSQT